MEFNKYQSTIEELNLETYPKEVLELFWDFINNVPYIKYMVGDRPRAKDLPRDSKGRIIVDITKPHILENMEYFMPSAINFRKTGRYTSLRPNANPNSEFGRWILEEVRRCWEGYIRKSDGEWIPGNMYFFLNYCPIPLTKIKGNSKKGERVIDFPEFWEGIYYRFHYIDLAQNGGIYNEKGGNNGCEISSRGKAHPYSQIVYTPEGIKSWGEIKIGDYLFGDDGNTTKVLNIPFDDYQDVYKITLKDGRIVYSSGNHLWKVWRNYSHCYKIKSTLEMIKDFKKSRKISDRNPKGVEYNYKIPNHKGVDFNNHSIPIDAYTMGLLLGDGSFRTYKLRNYFYYTSDKSDMLTYKSIVPYEIRKMKNKMQYYISFTNARGVLEDLNLYMKKSEDKFIPDCYKFNSRKVRLNTLRGLMDSDGFVDSNGIPIIGVSSKRLANDIAFIARSLGYNCLQSIKKAGYKKDNNYIKCLDSYIVRIYTNDRLFNLERKQSLVTKFESNYSRSNRDFSTIVNIEYSHKEKCKCVTVDNESHCYLIGDFITTHNSKSLTMASIMAKYFVLGESRDVNKAVKCMATAYQKLYLTSDGILNKFQSYIDFLALNTLFPSKRLKSSLQDMAWKMGYMDLDTGTLMGTLNEVLGVSAKDDPSKVRGKRMHFIVVEEFGSFRNVLELYNIMLPSVQEGDISFGTMYLIGTSGDDESDFQGAAEIVYNPKGYRMYALPNVFDKEGQGRREITFFFPGFINRKGCYDKDGNSDVTKAILEILSDRYRIKYNSSDINSITKAISEIPITPQEAILRTKGNLFPITQLNERLNQIDSIPGFYDDTYTGELILNKYGKVEFKPTPDMPIREFPLKDNKSKGAVEIFLMPEEDKNGNVYNERYIIGFDPYDNDLANSMSLGSIFVLDLFTDKLVAEYTGRTNYADELYEICRRLCIFYNAKCLYEAHPYDQLVRLPDGTTKLWGDVKIGDRLLSPSGPPVEIVDIPMEGIGDIYRITLDDGRQVEASSNHIWKVKRLNHKDYEELHTIDMYKEGVLNKHKQHNFFIPESGKVDYPHKDVPIDPYTMGLLIAEGALTKFKKDKFQVHNRRVVQISSSREDMDFYKTVIPYECKYIGTKGYSYHLYIDNVDLILDSLGLLLHDSYNKFIPELYLFNDYNTRLELLKGLMDGDGCAVKQGASVYITTSEQLSEDIKLLCRSLGIKTKNNKDKEEYMMKNLYNEKEYKCSKVYRVSICSEIPIFKLPRKVNKQHIYNPNSKGSKAKGFLYNNAIINIEYVGKKQCKCVTVSNPDGLYLIGDYVVTHNCNKKGTFAYFSKMVSVHMLADTPEYLRDKQLVKYSSFGSNSKGVNASLPINNFANDLIREWLIKPVNTIVKEDGEEKEVLIPNLFFIKNRALLKELILFNPDINVDRVRSLGMLMLYRQEKMILYLGDVNSNRQEEYDSTYLGNDPFFTNNYNNRFENIIL